VFEVVEQEHLDENARNMGNILRAGLEKLAAKYPHIIRSVRGMGLMLGFELASDFAPLANGSKPASIQFLNRLHAAGLLAIVAGTHIIRLLPPLNLKLSEAEEALSLIEKVLSEMH
jgi:acetylornithine/succinyldiaminopimelate/putrescine aminotransferase